MYTYTNVKVWCQYLPWLHTRNHTYEMLLRIEQSTPLAGEIFSFFFLNGFFFFSKRLLDRVYRFEEVTFVSSILLWSSICLRFYNTFNSMAF